MKSFKITSLVLILMLIIGCGQQVESPSSEGPLILQFVPVQILISEVLTGIEGNNQADYIELYNPGTEIADLKGYSTCPPKTDPEVVLGLVHTGGRKDGKAHTIYTGADHHQAA